MMDIRDDQNHLFNITLAKCTGLYQFFDSQTMKFSGKNVYQICFMFITLCMCVVGVIMTISGVYYWSNNMPLSVDYYWKSIVSLYTSYSMWVVVQNSNDIWNCLSITCYGFTSHSLRDRHILDRWREQSVLLTTILIIAYLTTSIIYFVSSLVVSNDILQVKNRDGSVSNYRSNVVNLCLFVSDETYNAHYNMFYIGETLFVIFVAIGMYVFDFLLVTLCLAIRCQMQMVCTAFESVGHKSLGDDLSSVGEYGFRGMHKLCILFIFFLILATTTLINGLHY